MAFNPDNLLQEQCKQTNKQEKNMFWGLHIFNKLLLELLINAKDIDLIYCLKSKNSF